MLLGYLSEGWCFCGVLCAFHRRDFFVECRNQECLFFGRYRNVWQGEFSNGSFGYGSSVLAGS